MSNIQYAFISRSRVPNRSELQASIDALGFDLKLHPEYTPFADSRFLPFTLNGEEGPGFEIQYESASEVIDEDKSLQEIAAGRDYCISMAWHGSMKDLACVLIVSCALMKDFESVVSYEGNSPEPLENMLSVIPEVLVDAHAQEDRATNRSMHIQQKSPWWKIW